MLLGQRCFPECCKSNNVQTPIEAYGIALQYQGQHIGRRIGHLKNVSKAFVGKVGYTEASFTLPLHEPGPTLALRINKNRGSCSACYKNTILNAKLISWQSLCAHGKGVQ